MVAWVSISTAERPLLVVLGLVLGGCGLVVPEAVVPMPVVARQLLGPQQATGLLVLLPGAGDRAGTFVDEGVIDSVTELAPGFDVIAADAHFGYYTQDSVMPRLEVDVIGPAREAGYRQIWLLGVSLGGFGSLVYAAGHPGAIDGVLLLGPFLGDSHIAESLMAAPSLAAWDPAGFERESRWHAMQADVWTWLQRQTGPAADAEVFLAYGDGDGPGTFDERLHEALPASHFAMRPGGHAWTVWRPLIRDLLPRMLVAARARAARAAAAVAADDEHVDVDELAGELAGELPSGP